MEKDDFISSAILIMLFKNKYPITVKDQKHMIETAKNLWALRNNSK